MKQPNQFEDSTKIDDRINDRLDDRVTFLIEMYIFEGLTPEEHEELNNWVAHSDNNRLVFEEATNEKMLQQGLRFLKETNVSANLKRIKEKIPFATSFSFQPTFAEPVLGADPVLEPEVKPTIDLRNRQWLVAATIIFLVGAAMAYYLSIHDPGTTKDMPPGKAIATLMLSGTNVLLDSTTKDGPIKVENGYTIRKEKGQIIYDAGGLPYTQGMAGSEHVIETPRAGTYPVTLSDGTKLWLNPSSSISFPPVFPDNERRVSITGEVYFEVAKSATRDGRKKSFIVEVKDKDVKIEVLGTHFNINAYTDEPSVKTTLVEGSVKVITSRQASLLKPGEQAEINNHVIKVTDIGEDGKRAIQASKEGNFDLQKSDIKSLLREIGRWYDIDVQYPANMPERHFGGQVNRNRKLSEVIKTLNLNGIKCELKGKKIIVKP